MILDAGQKLNSKGAGKGAKLNRVTPDNKPICYAWNNGQACKNPGNCTFEHVCQICFAADHTKDNCPKKGGA